MRASLYRAKSADLHSHICTGKICAFVTDRSDKATWKTSAWCARGTVPGAHPCSLTELRTNVCYKCIAASCCAIPLCLNCWPGHLKEPDEHLSGDLLPFPDSLWLRPTCSAASPHAQLPRCLCRCAAPRACPSTISGLGSLLVSTQRVPR